MKKKFICRLSLLALLLSGSTFAITTSNECLQNVEDHIYEGQYLVLGNCKLKDRDMPAVLSVLSEHPAIKAVLLEIRERK